MACPKRMNFRKSSKGGGGGIFNPKIDVPNWRKNMQHDFTKMRGVGQKPFGTFPKIHLFGDATRPPKGSLGYS